MNRSCPPSPPRCESTLRSSASPDAPTRRSARGLSQIPAHTRADRWAPVSSSLTTLRRAVALAALLSLTAGSVLHAPAWAAPKTVELTLVAGKTSANSTLNFNGYANGKMTLTIPTGWTVIVHYQNASALRHSFDVIPFNGKQPDPPPPRPAFKGAATADPVSGLGVGRSETLTFKVDRAGKYEFLCGVLGHAQAGMWDFLIVSDGAKGPTVTPAAAATLKVR